MQTFTSFIAPKLAANTAIATPRRLDIHSYRPECGKVYEPIWTLYFSRNEY